MVAVNLYMHQFGAVAIIAALFAVVQVNGEKGCTIDLGNVADFDFNCNDVKNSWTVDEAIKDSAPENVLALLPEKDGCLRSKNTVILNLTSPVSLKFCSDSPKDESKLSLRLIPKEGNCPDEECVWEIVNDAICKPGEWITAGHSFPLKSMKEYYVQIQAGKSKGKLLLHSLTFPTANENSNACKVADSSLGKVDEASLNEISVFDKFTGEKVNDTKKNLSPNLGELSKNLMLTSASVLTLNNLLN